MDPDDISGTASAWHSLMGASLLVPACTQTQDPSSVTGPMSERRRMGLGDTTYPTDTVLAAAAGYALWRPQPSQAHGRGGRCCGVLQTMGCMLCDKSQRMSLVLTMQRLHAIWLSTSGKV